MIELAGGVIFLVTSLYGKVQATTTETIEQPVISTTTISSSKLINDQKAMEVYLEREFKDTPILVDVARCESNFRQFNSDGDVIRGRANKYDVGVMQINEKYHAEMAKKLGIDIYSVEGNVEYAKHLYRESGTAPWSASSKCWSSSLALN